MWLICILPEFLGWLKSGMLKTYSRILRMIRLLKIRLPFSVYVWKFSCSCFSDCAYGEQLRSWRWTWRWELCLFLEYFVSVLKTQKELSLACHLYVVTITTPSPDPEGLKKKWMTSLKMYLGISNGTCCNIFQGSKKYATRQWPANNRTWGLSLITSRSKRCASRQWEWIHGGWNLFLIAGKHTKCVMRQWPTMMLCSWIKEWFLLIPMGYYFVCLRYCSLLFLIVLKLKKCVKMPLKKSMGIGVCCWSL